MSNMMVTGSSNQSGAAFMTLRLAVFLLAIPVCARGGGGGSAKPHHRPPTHGLPDRAHFRDSHPPRSDKVLRTLPSSRSHSVAPSHSRCHQQRGSGDRPRESTANLAQRINKLAKNPSPRGRRELAAAINELPKDQRFYDAAPKDLALLTNGIGKLLDGPGEQSAANRILNTLAREVCHRNLGYKQWRWQQQTLAMMVNGFSKGAGTDITRALNVLAQAVGKQELGQWSEQGLAMVVNGLCKGTGAEITEALNRVAQVIAAWEINVDQWTAQHLAMVINGISKGTREKITQALNIFARVVEAQEHNMGQWTAQDLAMVINGLSKGTGEEINRALSILALAVLDRHRELGRWTGRQLVMVVGGLSKGVGNQIIRALSALAKAVIHRQRELNRWMKQDLAMLACGFGKGVGAVSVKCLQVLAQEVMGRDLGRWTDQHLVMVSSGVSQGTGVEIAQCLETLTLEIAGRDRSRWSPQTLAMAADGMREMSENPMFGQLITELANRAAQEPFWLLMPLKKLCRSRLSREQVDAAVSLLEALHRCGYRPKQQEARNEWLWYLTLVHFSNQHILAASGASRDNRDQLVQLYRHYIETESDDSESHYVVDSKTDNLMHDREQGQGTKRWQTLFARDYWQGEHRQYHGGTPSPPTVLPGGTEESASQLQTTTYQAIKEILPSHLVEMEVSVNDFPVDILIDGRICIEVDGPIHYLQPEQNPDSQSRAIAPEHGDNSISVPPSQPSERRAKDRFIDHMLAQYGYQVFRIPYTYRPESSEFRALVNQIQASLVDY